MSTAPDPSPGRGIGGARSARRDNPEGRMPLVEHIRELRNRLVKGGLGVVVGTVVGWLLFHPVYTIITRPYCEVHIPHKTVCDANGPQFGASLVFNGPFDAFFVRVKVALIVGLLISSPIWFYQLWAFIAPGLYSREKRWAWAFVGSGVPLFGLGSFFAYLALSKAMGFLVSLIPPTAAAVFTVDTYLSYVQAMMLIFGLAFELPLVLVILNLAGILRHDFFRKWRRVMIFAVVVFAGAFTPSPDPFSMLLLAVPCVVLVEAAEVIIWLNDRRRAQREAAENPLLQGDALEDSDDDKVDADWT